MSYHLTEDYEFISSTINGDLLLNTKLVFDAMKIKTERKRLHKQAMDPIKFQGFTQPQHYYAAANSI